MNRTAIRRLLGGLLVTGLAGPALVAQTVTVPLDVYDRLRAQGSPVIAQPALPDTGVSFESLDFAVVVAAGHARITASATVWLHRDDWQSLPWSAELPLLAARAATCEIRLIGEGETRRLELRGKPGRHRLELESTQSITRTVTATRPTGSFSLPLPAAARVGGTLETDEEVTATDDLRIERVGPRQWRFTGRPGGTAWLTLAGAPAAVIAERPLRFEVTTATALVLQRTRRQAEAWIAGQVVEGRLESLTIPAPEGFEVVSVEGLEGLGAVGWQVAKGTLEVDFLGPAPNRWLLHASLAADAATESSVPVLVPTGARRATVVTKAEARGGGILEPAGEITARTAEAHEVETLPAPFQARLGEPLIGPAGASTPRWRVTWPAEVRVLGAQVDRLLVDVLVGEHGRAFYQIWAVVRANGAPDLALALPTGARLVDSRRDGTPARLGQRGGAWVSPLVSRDSEQVLFWSAEVVLPWPATDGGRLEIPIPHTSSPISTVEVRASLPAPFRYEWVDPSRRGNVGQPPRPVLEEAGASALNQQLHSGVGRKGTRPAGGVDWQPLPSGFQVLTASWSSLDTTPSPLVLNVRRVPEARP
ncbi:MAG: hypothetical protein SF066_22415 [Thermoanaerobaculia bacterium]|nr:hypothetical protein [Thermoanaerobaculia bacterium]